MSRQQERKEIRDAAKAILKMQRAGLLNQSPKPRKPPIMVRVKDFLKGFKAK